jgi:hypothetical protein
MGLGDALFEQLSLQVPHPKRAILAVPCTPCSRRAGDTSRATGSQGSPVFARGRDAASGSRPGLGQRDLRRHRRAAY